MERATFTPLVLSSTGGMGKAATTSCKWQDHGLALMELSFALPRPSVMCIKGARSSAHHMHPATDSLDFQLAEAHLKQSVFL